MDIKDILRFALACLIGAALTLLILTSQGCGAPPPAIDWAKAVGIAGDIRCSGEASVTVFGAPVASVKGTSGAVGATVTLEGLVCAGLRVSVGPLSWSFVAATQADSRCSEYAGRLMVSKND